MKSAASKTSTLASVRPIRVNVQGHSSRDLQAIFDAISRSQAVIEFLPDGTILEANSNFLNALGYGLDEIVGKHHGMFCMPEYTVTREYTAFWSRLAKGEFFSQVFRRIKKDGSSIWIQASYNPVFDSKSNVVRVIKLASDITEQFKKSAFDDAQIIAVNRAMAVIEFLPDGTILNANQNFLSAVGYREDEIKGRHHRMFCDAQYVASPEYQEFWASLVRGEFIAKDFKRFGAGGKVIYINGSYNPIFDVDGKVTKVVKYATNITKERENYNKLVDTFDKACFNLSSAAEELMRSATQVSASSSASNQQANQVAAASDEVSRSVQGVATATEEMIATVKEISNSASQTSTVSSQAKENAKHANTAVSELGVASEEIGSVSKVISSIAQQTNLLALNATIEAARAGDAGRGFAVVANEVKELAKKTGEATDNITARVDKIQSSTKATIEALSTISEMIEKISQMATSTAVVTEEQVATTREVARLLSNSDQGVRSITASIREVAGASEACSSGAQESETAASRLARLSTELKILVDQSRAE